MEATPRIKTENQLSLDSKKSSISDRSEPATCNQGFVEFDLGNVDVPGLGSFPVKSKYPRLKPNFERDHVENCDVKVLAANLMAWINEHFETNGNEKNLEQLATISVLFVVYTNPIPELYSEDLDLTLKFTFWLWYNDDVIEQLIQNRIDCEALKQGSDQLQSILTGKYDNDPTVKFVDVPNYPIFRNLFHSLLQLHTICGERLTEYKIRVKNLSDNLREYFTALRLYNEDPIDGRHSEESFQAYRKVMAFFDGIANVIAMVNNVQISDKVSNSEKMKRLWEVTNAFGGFTNDLLGMKKEFANGEQDNLIVFMVLEKKIPMDVAVQRVCDILEGELREYFLLKDGILAEFDHDVNLVKYLDILESLIDGHNVIYLESSRHRAVGSVTLTR